MNLHKSPINSVALDSQYVTRKYLDVPYGDKYPEEKLDIYLPEEGDGRFPVIVDIHGGGWHHGIKSNVKMAPMLSFGLKRGYAVVSVGYTLSGQSAFPMQIFDIKAAIRFLKANSEQYHLDVNHIGLWGLSAGAHLASLAAVSPEIPWLEDLSMGNANQDASVQCVVSLYGVADLGKMDRQYVEMGLDPNLSDDSCIAFLGASPKEVPGLVKMANPETYITSKAPPFLIQHGLADVTVPCLQSILLADKLEKEIGQDKVTLELFQGVDHADAFFRTPENTERIFKFLDQYLKR